MSDIRQAFEQWIGHHGKRSLERTEAGYSDSHVRADWYAWEAACHWMRERELEDVERLVKERLETKK
jgi:hypothetical protein